MPRAYDEDPHLTLPRTNTTQHGTRPKLDQSPTSSGARSHMATSVITPNSLAKLLPCIPGTDPLCALWAYLIGFANKMAKTIFDKPP